jgi:hypothetical protein
LNPREVREEGSHGMPSRADMRATYRLLAAAILVVLGPVEVAAQTGARLAAGPSFVVFRPADERIAEASGFGVITRLGRGTGWGPALEFPAFGTDLTMTIAGRPLPFGHLNVWSVLGGVAYTVAGGPVSLSLSVLGGYAFNDISLAGPARTVYEQELGFRSVDLEVTNAPAFKPGVAVWLDVGPSLGILASAGYLVLRPEITLLTDTDRQAGRWRADAVVLQVGVVYRIF